MSGRIANGRRLDVGVKSVFGGSRIAAPPANALPELADKIRWFPLSE